MVASAQRRDALRDELRVVEAVIMSPLSAMRIARIMEARRAAATAVVAARPPREGMLSGTTAGRVIDWTADTVEKRGECPDGASTLGSVDSTNRSTDLRDTNSSQRGCTVLKRQRKGCGRRRGPASMSE